MPKRKPAKAQPPAAPAVDIPEDEQWRIVRDSGVLQQLGAPAGSVRALRAGTPDAKAADAEALPLADELFNATTLVIPMSFMLFLMEVLVHWQYGREPTAEALWERMSAGVPIISVFVFYTNRYKAHRRMQLALFVLSMLVGARLVWQINTASWKVVMKQCPPLATLWLYTVVQLDLAPAALGLGVVIAWAWYKKLNLLSVK